jgi:hypothetical protein
MGSAGHCCHLWQHHQWQNQILLKPLCRNTKYSVIDMELLWTLIWGWDGSLMGTALMTSTQVWCGDKSNRLFSTRPFHRCLIPKDCGSKSRLFLVLPDILTGVPCLQRSKEEKVACRKRELEMEVNHCDMMGMEASDEVVLEQKKRSCYVLMRWSKKHDESRVNQWVLIIVCWAFFAFNLIVFSIPTCVLVHFLI